MTAPQRFTVTHSQRYFDKPNGERKAAVFTVKADGDRGFYASAAGFGCSKTYATAEGAIRGMCADHAQDVHSIEPEAVEPEPVAPLYEAEQFHVSASIEGLGVVWEETLSAQDALSIMSDLTSADPGRNVIAENGYDVSRITITARAVALSDFDKLCQDHRREKAAEAAAEAAEAAERAARIVRNEMKADVELVALGVEFTVTPSDAAASAWRDGRVMATAMRARVYSQGPAWKLYDRDGAEIATASNTLGIKRALIRLACGLRP